jgi:hypothetical protein
MGNRFDSMAPMTFAFAGMTTSSDLYVSCPAGYVG